MLRSDYKIEGHLPTMEELPYKDDKSVDSELQDLIAHLLKDILALIWANRNDWFFGIDTGWYYDPDESAIAQKNTIRRLGGTKWNPTNTSGSTEVRTTYKKMAFLPRQKPGFLKKPGFLNLDAGEGIELRNPVFYQPGFWAR